MFDINRAKKLATTDSSKKRIKFERKIDKEIECAARQNKAGTFIVKPITMNDEMFKSVISAYEANGYEVTFEVFGVTYDPDKIIYSGATLSWE